LGIFLWRCLSRRPRRFQRELSAQIRTIGCVNDHGPRTVYLDINHWYALARADTGNPDKPEHAAVLSKLQGEVDAGRLAIPLSSVTYAEPTENPRDQLREPAATVMLKLSRLVTIAPRHKIVDEELARQLNRRFGRTAFPIKVPKAGTASTLQDGASASVKDAYTRVTALVKGRFANRPKGQEVLAEHQAAPQTWEAPLAAELSAAGADCDAVLVAAAQALMNLVDEAGAQAGKYAVTVRDSQGVQIGAHNTQTNTFRPRPI
jgi:RIP homotypic interaction motif